MTPELLAILVALVVGIAALPLLARGPYRSARQTPRASVLRKRLRAMGLGDDRVIDRLLARERRRNPTATEEQHLQRIIDDWISDHSR